MFLHKILRPLGSDALAQPVPHQHTEWLWKGIVLRKPWWRSLPPLGAEEPGAALPSHAAVASWLERATARPPSAGSRRKGRIGADNEAALAPETVEAKRSVF